MQKMFFFDHIPLSDIQNTLFLRVACHGFRFFLPLQVAQQYL